MITPVYMCKVSKDILFILENIDKTCNQILSDIRSFSIDAKEDPLNYLSEKYWIDISSIAFDVKENLKEYISFNEIIQGIQGKEFPKRHWENVFNFISFCNDAIEEIFKVLNRIKFPLEHSHSLEFLLTTSFKGLNDIKLNLMIKKYQDSLLVN
jgi:hypothetical protein